MIGVVTLGLALNDAESRHAESKAKSSVYCTVCATNPSPSLVFEFIFPLLAT